MSLNGRVRPPLASTVGGRDAGNSNVSENIKKHLLLRNARIKGVGICHVFIEATKDVDKYVFLLCLFKLRVRGRNMIKGILIQKKRI